MAARREKKKTSISYDVKKRVHELKQTLSQYKREYGEVLAMRKRLQAVMSNNNYDQIAATLVEKLQSLSKSLRY